MEKFYEIVRYAIEHKASDIHLLEGKSPVIRVNRTMITCDNFEAMNRYDLEGLLENLVGDSMMLVEQFEQNKVLDLPYEVENGVRLRINASMSSNVPTFAIRVIQNKVLDTQALKIDEIIDLMKQYNSGLILLTGKVNTGKTTTLNAFVQSLNDSVKKKIVMLEEPIEYKHTSKKCLIVQKEVNEASDIPTYYDGVINLLREDSDIAVIGEIRDRKTMDAVLDLSEAGGLVIGTLHTRSCGETIERILAMYNPEEQKAIKYSLSNILKLIISQKLVKNVKDELIIVPEILVSTNTTSALMRQDKFSVSEIKDAIHLGKSSNMISFEQSFANLIKQGHITREEAKKHLEQESMNLVEKLLGGDEV